MRWFVDGFVWDTRPAPFTDQRTAARAIQQIHANSSAKAAEARAAFSVGDWDHALKCAEAALKAAH